MEARARVRRRRIRRARESKARRRALINRPRRRERRRRIHVVHRQSERRRVVCAVVVCGRDRDGLALSRPVGRVVGPAPRTVGVLRHRPDGRRERDGVTRVRVGPAAGVRGRLAFGHRAAGVVARHRRRRVRGGVVREDVVASVLKALDADALAVCAADDGEDERGTGGLGPVDERLAGARGRRRIETDRLVVADADRVGRGRRDRNRGVLLDVAGAVRRRVVDPPPDVGGDAARRHVDLDVPVREGGLRGPGGISRRRHGVFGNERVGQLELVADRSARVGVDVRLTDPGLADVVVDRDVDVLARQPVVARQDHGLAGRIVGLVRADGRGAEPAARAARQVPEWVGRSGDPRNGQKR